MDKRTIIFVIALTLALFGVNIYFQQQHEESLRTWNEKHKVQLATEKKQLEGEIASNTASLSQLPVVRLYADDKGNEFVTSGIKSGETILALKWQESPPDKIYSHSEGTELDAYKLIYSSTKQGEPVVYQKGNTAPLKIGALPEFGKFHLQLVIANPKNEINPAQIILGDYSDGHFSLPIKKLEKINFEMQEGGKKLPQPFGNAIVLINSEQGGFLPVAIYESAQDKLVELDSYTGLNTTAPQTQAEFSADKSGKKTEENYYVLETPYQQLVFSNYGAALAEINLPFASKTNTQSVVREIDFDREMVEKHPYNAHFPSQRYYTPGETTTSFTENSQGQLGGYYPLIRRNLIASGNRKSIKIPPQYYALNIVSEYPELAELVYDVKYFDREKIVFEATQSHRRITKTFSIDQKAPYCVNLSVKIEGDSRGLWLTSGIPEVEWISGSPAPALKYRITRNNKSNVENIELPTESLTVTSLYPDWICNSNGFLGLIQDPLTQIDPGYRVQYVPGTVVPSRLIEIDQEHERFKAQEMPGYATSLPLKNNGGTMEFRVFGGPFSDTILKAVDKAYTDPATGYNPDYIACQSFHGWFSFISEPFAKFLFILMQFFYQMTHSWGFSIILLTVALRIMMYPLNAWSSKSMLRMQKIAPEVTAIQEKYKKDPKRAQIEVMNLYRERGVNPISGCLPMLIQMPFLIGMFDLLKSTFDLRGASFIPGWIDNLAAPDVLFSWNTPIFFIGNQFHLLPILLGLVMFLQQRMSSPLPKDTSKLTDQQRQQKAMGTIMSIVFTFMFYNFPSGLNIYWLSSMLLGILQQWWTTKRMESASALSPTKNKALK